MGAPAPTHRHVHTTGTQPPQARTYARPQGTHAQARTSTCTSTRTHTLRHAHTPARMQASTGRQAGRHTHARKQARMRPQTAMQACRQIGPANKGTAAERAHLDVCEAILNAVNLLHHPLAAAQQRLQDLGASHAALATLACSATWCDSHSAGWENVCQLPCMQAGARRQQRLSLLQQSQSRWAGDMRVQCVEAGAS